MSETSIYDNCMAEATPELYPHAKEVSERLAVGLAMSVLMGAGPDLVISALFAILRGLREDGKFYGDSPAELSTIFFHAMEANRNA